MSELAKKVYETRQKYVDEQTEENWIEYSEALATWLLSGDSEYAN